MAEPFLHQTSPARPAAPGKLYGAASRRTKPAQQLAALMGKALENLERAEAARQAARMRDQFLGSIAHDTSNPLTALRLRTGVLLKAAPGSRARAA